MTHNFHFLSDPNLGANEKILLRGWRGVIGSTPVFANLEVRVRTPSPTLQSHMSFIDRLATVL